MHLVVRVLNVMLECLYRKSFYDNKRILIHVFNTHVKFCLNIKLLLTFAGMNAIVLYMGHEMIKKPLQTFWGLHPKSHMVYLPINIADTAVFVILAYFLYRHKIFISV